MQKNATSCCDNPYPDISLAQFQHKCLTDYAIVTAVVQNLIASIHPRYFLPRSMSLEELC